MEISTYDAFCGIMRGLAGQSYQVLAIARPI